MKTIKFIVPAAVATVGLLISSAPSYGKPEYSKKEKTGCVTCHVSAKSKDLNDVGKCYSDKKELKTCATKK
jgi:hypothetical protein